LEVQVHNRFLHLALSAVVAAATVTCLALSIAADFVGP
jgi:hypothetical protein